MKEDFKKIINNYGVMPQLKYFQSEVFEFNEAIVRYEEYMKRAELPISEVEKRRKHIAEEIADVLVMLLQFKEYYGISDFWVERIMKEKIERQLGRIENENSK